MELEKILKEKLAKPNKTIMEHTNEVIEQLNQLNEFGYIPNEKVYQLTKKACELHDIGKINKEFQLRVDEKEKKKSFEPQKEVAHNVLSAFLINPEQFKEKKDYYKILFAVLYHHYYGDALKDIENKGNLIKALLKDFNTYPIKKSSVFQINNLIEEKDTEAIWIKGLLHKCDYSASAGYPVELPNYFLVSALEKQLDRWKEKDYKAEWKELQQFCMKNQKKNIIGIAQTGMGKTEGGLLWMGDKKGFFVLPIRTAINAIYERVANNLLENQEVLDKVGILYSDSLEYYMNHVEEESHKLLEYEQRGKALSLPLSIATLDQLFDFVLKYPAYELKLATLAYSKIVIDEIQMYEPNLLAYLIHGLKMIYKMGGKIAILTATFSPFLRKLLEPIEFEEAKFIDDSKRHHVKVLNQEINAEEISDYYKEQKNRKSSCKVLVICNTIKKAQQIYEELKEFEEIEDELHILHSMFIKKDRAKKESEILKFGATFDENENIYNDFGIWISTPLVEASLDIDFDILFTELKDISSLFQRFGRCNRKGKKSTDEVNCFVYTQVDSIKNGEKGFIDGEIYELSKKAMEHVSGILSEQKKVQLIEEYFTFENLKNSDYIRGYERVSNYLESLNVYEESKKINLRDILSEDVIPYCVFQEHMEEIRECEKKLEEKSITKLERLKLRDKISQYTVSVPLYKVKNYEKAINEKLAIPYEGVHINQYRKIKIMECYYDEMGFKEIDFKNYIREANML